MRRFLIGLALVAGALLAACAAPSRVQASQERIVLLVSIDGFRADYLDRGRTPVLSALAARGARAKGMRPSFPTVTFPNHYTLVTGLRPDRHGLVNNVMEDPLRPGAVFTQKDRSQSLQPHWWDEAEPLWVTAERAGVRTATLFWPGSELPIRGVQPRDWLPFDQSMPSAARVETVMTWLDRPTASRPRFVTLYFDIVDTQGHNFGPDSPELNAALAEVDAAIGALFSGLEKRELLDRTDIVVAADHGMAAVTPERTVDLDALVDHTAFRLAWSGRSLAGVVPAPGREREVEAALIGRHGAMECWAKGDVPARFHFGRHRRVPPIVCLADVGWMIGSRAQPATYAPLKGAHGFDPEAPDMAALFVAAGPSFKENVTVPTFNNVHVYPLLARLLGVAPGESDGDLAVLAPALK